MPFFLPGRLASEVFFEKKYTAEEIPVVVFY
jgi:hypothetical protein